jgi:hypothetical protein
MTRTPFLLAVLLAATAAAQATPQAEVIASGLANPRGIAFSPNGELYVAEAGRGGNGNCTTIADGQLACYGESGAITRVDPTGASAPRKVLSGLPSLAGQPAGIGATGVQDIAFLGAGNAQIVLGLGANAQARVGLGPKSHLLGSTLQVNAARGWKYSGDIAAAENEQNPVPATTPPGVPDLKDSNPYGIAALPGRHLVADAGANTIWEVRTNGAIRPFAVFPARGVTPPFPGLPNPFPMQAVPTTVTVGPDGWVYAAQLTGFPFPLGAANVYRIPPEGGAPQVYASGFTNIVDIAFDASGQLYVLQIGNGLAAPGGPPLAAPGKLIRVNANGTQTVVYAQLFYPGGLAIGPDGAAYVTNFGIAGGPSPIFPTGGQVLRITLD